MRDLDDRLSCVQLADPVREDGPTPDHSEVSPLDISAGLLEVAACLTVDQSKLERTAKQRLELVVVAWRAADDQQPLDVQISKGRGQLPCRLAQIRVLWWWRRRSCGRRSWCRASV